MKRVEHKHTSVVISFDTFNPMVFVPTTKEKIEIDIEDPDKQALYMACLEIEEERRVHRR